MGSSAGGLAHRRRARFDAPMKAFLFSAFLIGFGFLLVYPRANR